MPLDLRMTNGVTCFIFRVPGIYAVSVFNFCFLSGCLVIEGTVLRRSGARYVTFFGLLE